MVPPSAVGTACNQRSTHDIHFAGINIRRAVEGVGTGQPQRAATVLNQIAGTADIGRNRQLRFGGERRRTVIDYITIKGIKGWQQHLTGDGGALSKSLEWRVGSSNVDGAAARKLERAGAGLNRAAIIQE